MYWKLTVVLSLHQPNISLSHDDKLPMQFLFKYCDCLPSTRIENAIDNDTFAKNIADKIADNTHINMCVSVYVYVCVRARARVCIHVLIKLRCANTRE